MPDWSYHTLFKPILSNFSSSNSREFIHKGMNTVTRIPFGKKMIRFLGHFETNQKLKQEVFDFSVKNPIGLSSLIDPFLSGTNAFMNLGFGIIEIGPFSTNPSTETLIPMIDLKNDQVIKYEQVKTLHLDAAIKKLSKIDKSVPISVRVIGNLNEFQMIESKIAPFVDIFVIDYSLYNEIYKHQFIPKKPICLSVQPYELESVVSSINNISYESILIEENPLNSHEENKKGLLHFINLLKHTSYKGPIFTKGGIIEPIDAIEILDAGANLVFLTHGYVISGPGLPKRINEAQLNQQQHADSISKGWIWYFLFGFIMFFGGLLALIVSVFGTILPYDENFLHMTRETIFQFNQRILLFMSHDRMTLSGTILSGGILFMSLALFGIRQKFHWTIQISNSSAITGFLAIFLFIGFGYFDWLHALFWLILLPFFLIGYFSTKGLNEKPTSHNLFNNRFWKKSLIGQLCFIILGFSIVLGGLVIAFVGITTTFVSTDLDYLCITPSQINQFNERLIPVISHDRAGFGGGLISVGLIVLMLSLWGFRQGEKWIWWTLFLGSIPAFYTAFAIHFMIGYTDFIHLLPPVIATLLLVIGLLMSYQFLHLKNETMIKSESVDHATIKDI
ncbi:dihydroorotate dehydrogenase [Bacillus sp. EAC]|uniref:dihydroorotate dehydrogenase n=1 Tax=Bacillus sp. EAC TaxID=1978338 RepID=UPI000B4382EC|nr:dihydroorotate dehydrogenase [Bacillus sp. EAC]